MIVDILELKWKNKDTKHLVRITKMEPINDVVLLWFKDLGTAEVHCMSEDMFLLMHESCGSSVFSEA